MGEMITEPSMEEILSSIKRIIAEEGDGPGRGRRLNRPSPASSGDHELLELNQPVDEPEPDREGEGAQVSHEAAPEPAQAASVTPMAVSQPSTEPVAEIEPIVSPTTAEASRGALDALSRAAAKAEPGGDGALEGVVREMLRPMLRQWLDANLPAMVEKMVASEIARITGQQR